MLKLSEEEREVFEVCIEDNYFKEEIIEEFVFEDEGIKIVSKNEDVFKSGIYEYVGGRLYFVEELKKKKILEDLVEDLLEDLWELYNESDNLDLGNCLGNILLDFENKMEELK